MKLYRLGAIPWDETQAIYHALAHNGQEGLVICRPASPCVCLGLHDDVKQEVNLEYCRDNSLPLIRRDIGGGMVLLAEGQLFFQLVLRAGNPLLTGRREQFFTQFLQPAVRTLADFGIRAALKPPADIVVNGRKISGNGAGDINGYAVYTGNILLTFNRQVMTQVFNVPAGRFRAMVGLSLEQYLTTMTDELGYEPDIGLVEERLVSHFAAWLDVAPGEYSPALQASVRELSVVLTSPEFLSLPGKLSYTRQVKIKEGTYVRLHPFPQCIKTTLAGQGACNNRLGSPCTGYAILVVEDKRIVEFEYYGLACLDEFGLNSLSARLTGRSWQKYDIGDALAEWLVDDQTGARQLLKEPVTNWILGT